MTRRDDLWTFRSRQTGRLFEQHLSLTWEIDGTSICDDFDADADLLDIWDAWIRSKAAKPKTGIYWSVPDGIHEQAPLYHATGTGRRFDDFLTFYTWPQSLRTGEPLRWTALKIDGYHEWFQRLTGWSPSPLQQTADIDLIARACDLPRPAWTEETT